MRYSARLRAQKSEQRQKAHQTVNSDYPVAHLSEAPTVRTQRLGDVAGALDCPVRQRRNGYTAPTVVCNGTVKVNSARLRAQ